MNTFLAPLLSIVLLALSNVAAADWFLSSETKALIVKAEAGDIDAQLRVGAAYDFGKGAPRDGTEAMRWYRMAADRDNAEAQNSVGSGLQAEKRYEEALPWYEKASAQGHALATNNLAYLHDLGLGVKQDRRKGFELYSHAADLGWAEAMWNIANMYGAGQLGEKDMVSACVWAMRARKFSAPQERQLQNHLSRVIPQLEGMLSPEQLASCNQQSENWAPIAFRKKDAQPGNQQDAAR
ncbi:tetratricopeptide repeat protein [Quatrionicoccus australiensis]|uniref:tetratricopeptide repeat protein n=1 Tax=Quatrionicoccus australiensis TaxID=138118 RepID=UPI001CF93DB8|nr:tetratricopeptide repeat protein [Quatrionicoccus australiensis]MCB4361385.1 sel1 repeat family protein [Quatrionicoccus australiensis]